MPSASDDFKIDKETLRVFLRDVAYLVGIGEISVDLNILSLARRQRGEASFSILISEFYETHCHRLPVSRNRNCIQCGRFTKKLKPNCNGGRCYHADRFKV